MSANPAWQLPAAIKAISVLPDRYTDTSSLPNLPGKETDPGRMGMFICLLDERPHLHPNLAALHKHRSVAHDIPPPPNPQSDPPVSSGKLAGEGKEWLTWRFSPEEELRRKAYLPLA